MAATEKSKRIAIACQGGGSHTAFTAGVLKRLFQSDEIAKYEIVGLSGTSGGAVCALLTWYALLNRDPGRVGRLLDEFWTDNSANSPLEQLANSWVTWAGTLQHFVVTPAVSPYSTLVSVSALNDFRTMLQRRVDFDRLEVQADGSQPALVIGAVDVLSGEFKAFNSRHDRISADMILASAAIPTLFRSVRVHDARYWDGLFSQNPPVKELVDWAPTKSGSSRSTRKAGLLSRRASSISKTAETNCRETCPCTRSCTSSRRSTSFSTRVYCDPTADTSPS